MTGNGSKPADNFPVDSFKEAAIHLRRPFSPYAVRWKIQSNLSNNRGLIVGYLDARLVIERLNLVVPHLWSAEFTPFGDRIDSGSMICTLTIDGLARSDVGTGQGRDKAKAAYSDALKRAAVHFGVGVPLYAVPAMILASTEKGAKQDGKPTLRRAKNKKNEEQLWITPSCEAWLAKQYEKWLEEHGSNVFGDQLDHGDVEGSVGALLEGGAAADEPEQGDLESAAKRQEAERVYAELKPAQRKKLSKGRFKAKLDGSESVEQLDRLIGEVKELAGAAA